METVTGNDIATTEQLLEEFIAANYSLESQNTRNCFCIECMEGPLHKSQFKARRPHANHPSLRVQKHTSQKQVVSRGDLGKVIDSSRPQPFSAHYVVAFALHARQDVTREQEPSAERRMCEQCQDTISSTDPEITLCSIECLLRSNRAPDQPLTAPSQRIDQQAETSTRTDVILSGRIRVRRTSKRRRTMESDTEANDEDDDEMPLLGAQPTEPCSAEESGRPEVARVPNAAAGVRSERAERRWSIARQATMAATSEQNPNFNRHDLARVRLVGTYARFMLDLLPDYAEDDAGRSNTT